MLPATASLESLFVGILKQAVTSEQRATEIRQKLEKLENELKECGTSQCGHPASSRDGIYAFKDGPAYKKVVERYGYDIEMRYLLSIARPFSKMLNLRLPREAQRKKTELYRWLDVHWDQVGPLMDHGYFDKAAWERLLGRINGK